jgi:aerobic-type carbon monoxide dehydrogenase small subunit (CoxS/CutS family)
MQLSINGQNYEAKSDPSTPLLWVLRDELGLVGTKYGCGMAQCGACTVHVNGSPVRSCVTPISSLAGRKITTIEGLAKNGADHPVQKAWEELNVPQCGYCQAGQLMTAAALIDGNKNPSDADIDGAMSGNLCRCGTYVRIRAAVKRAGEIARSA